jgi:hypothetical protein
VLVRLEALPGRCDWLIWLESLAWNHSSKSGESEISQIAHSALNEMCFWDFLSNLESMNTEQ